MPALINIWSVPLVVFGVPTSILNPLDEIVILDDLGCFENCGPGRVFWRQGILFPVLLCLAPKTMILVTLVFGLGVRALAVLTILLGLVLVVRTTWIFHLNRVNFLWLDLSRSFLL